MIDNRAVSIAITHALTIAITAVLISGLLISTGELLESQEQEVAQGQFGEIGSDIVSHINNLDRLNDTGTEVTASVTLNYQRQIAGESWTIELSDEGDQFDTDYAVSISTDLYDRTLQYPVNTTTDLDVGATARGDEPVLILCEGPGGDQIISLGECP
jgi:hypothetical protein